MIWQDNLALRHASTIKFLLSFYMSFISRHPPGGTVPWVLFIINLTHFNHRNK